MKKYLFISNSTKPTNQEYTSREKVRLTSFSKPCIEAALLMGYEVHMGVNRLYADELECDYDIKFYNSNTYRSLFDIKSNYTAYKNLMAVLKEHDIDVIHCNTPIGGLVGRICGKKAKVKKVIYTAHGFHFYKGAPLINRTVFKWAEKWLARYTDAIITINHEDYEAARKFRLRNNGRVYFVPGVGVNTQELKSRAPDRHALRAALGLNEDDIVLISMGDLVKRKNYSASIKAIAMAGNSKLHLLICGKGPMLGELMKLSRDLGIENQIHFLGFRSDIGDLLKISDIFLFTTLQEGLPRSLMEAMAAGLPCIVSKIRGNVDLVEEGTGGYLCAASDIKGFADAINRLASDEKLRSKMGETNQEKIKEYDYSVVSRKIREIYSAELEMSETGSFAG